MEVVELEVRSQPLLQPLPGGESLLRVGTWALPGGPGSPSGAPSPRAAPGSPLHPAGDSPASPVPRRVGVPHVSRVMAEVFGERLAAGARDAFPLQQKLLLCSLLLLARRPPAREVTLGKVSGGRTLSGLGVGSWGGSLGCGAAA